MDLIRVDPGELKRAAGEIERVAEGYRALAQRALDATQGAPSYDGQFGPRVASSGLEAHARLSGLAGQLSDLGQELVGIAEAFAAADADSAAAFHALALNSQRYVEAGLGGLFYSLLRPMHISDDVWNRLPLEDRIAILESYDLAFLHISQSAAGTVLYPRNPLRVRGEAGLNGEILAYAPAGSEVTRTGASKTANGIEWFQVRYYDALHGWVLGWVASGWLSDGRSRVGFEPDTVRERFEFHTDFEVWEGGGRLMSVTSDWLQIRDGPTHEYAAPEAIQWGQVVRWTGNSIEQGGHTWHQVTTWTELENGKLEPFTGWARADRVQEYAPDARAPDVLEDDRIWVQLPGERSFSQYNLFDVDSYVAPDNEFGAKVPIPWRWDIGPDGVNGPIEVPYGALYGADGVAMQGSGVVTVEVMDPETQERHQEKVYFTLNNPDQLDWVNSEEKPTSFGEGGWTNGPAAEIANPKDAEFRVLPEPPELKSGISVAAPPEYRGHRIWAPDLMDQIEGNLDAVFDADDAGGFFPAGSRRFDLWWEDAERGRDWYQSADRLNIPVYIDQPIPPGLDTIPAELLPEPTESEDPLSP